MDRAEKIGLGVAVVGHVVLFGLLSVGFLATPNPAKLMQQPVEVSLVKDVGLQAAAPQNVAPPAQSVAPDAGAPEDAAPPPPQEAAPAPEPDPAPPQPQPRPAPPEPVRQPKPAPAAKPAPTPAKPKPKPAAPEKAAAQPAPAKKASASAAAKPKPAAATGAGTKATATNARPRGSRLGANFLEGLTDKPSTSTSTAPRAAKIDARAMAGIVQAIARQIQPCADRQVNPGPGANAIVTTLNLRLNEDGTLAATPRMVRQSGVDGENDRYAQRVVDLGIAAFKGCSPLKLPAEYYSTPSGGWNNINFQWKLQ
jgi:outer membrane biosynthesis protein TonB